MWRSSIHLSLLLLSAIGLSAETYASDPTTSGAAAPVVVASPPGQVDSRLPAPAEHAPIQEGITVSQTDTLSLPELPAQTQTGATAASPGAPAVAGETVTTPNPATEPAKTQTETAQTPVWMTRQAAETNPPPKVIKKSSLPIQVMMVLVFDVLSVFMHIW
ncbi:MAG: hypothetical protein ACLQHK_06335 [Gallionellaceae bacterium]